MIITVLEVAGSIVGYVVIGLTWARSQAVRLQKLVNESQAREQKYGYRGAGYPWFTRNNCSWEKDFRRGLGLHGSLWPALLLARLASKLCDFASAPVEEARDEAKKYREEASEYRKVADDTGTTETERGFLEILIDTLLKQAKDRDL